MKARTTRLIVCLAAMVFLNIRSMMDLAKGMYTPYIPLLEDTFQRTTALYYDTPKRGQRPLPPIQWPQTDDGIRQSILHGERIDPDMVHVNDTHYTWQGAAYESPPHKNLVTMVSAFYDLKTSQLNIDGVPHIVPSLHRRSRLPLVYWF